MNYLRFFVLLFLMLVAALSCKKNLEEKRQFVEAEIQKRVDEYRNKRTLDCYNLAYEKANKLADSLVVVHMTATDTVGFEAQKPIKPIKPDFKSPLDTVEVKPLLPKQ
jgi:hypothetical protein